MDDPEFAQWIKDPTPILNVPVPPKKDVTPVLKVNLNYKDLLKA